MDFDWTPQPLREWRAMLARAPRANLLQSWPYARAVRRENQLMTKTALMKRGSDVIGLFQTQEVNLGPLHVVHMHRGPLWLDDAPSIEDWQDFLYSFSHAYPRRPGRWRRLMPSLPDTEDARGIMNDFGFHAKGQPYETIWLNLRPDLESLRARLKQKWRHALNKAERSGLTVELDRTAATRDWFVKLYTADKKGRGYRGAPPRFLRTLISEASLFNDVWILRAMDGETPIAGIVLFLHGSGATYQAGVTSERGRETNAHHLLLWNAIASLKDAGYNHFDLGGVHPQMAEGVTRFKLGLNGEHCVFSGLYS